MKLEKRDNTVFVSHGGMTIFFNLLKNKETGDPFYSINVNVASGDYENRKWSKAGQITLNPELFTDLTVKLATLQ